MFCLMKVTPELIDFVEDLRKEAAGVGATKQRSDYGGVWVHAGKFNELGAGCRLLVAKLGPFGHVYDELLQFPSSSNADHFDKISAILDSIAKALAKGRLATVEEIVSAEVLGDLLEHAEELLKSKFNFAAAIILRAVLEERLRKLCANNGCSPTGPRPTIENFKQSLYAANIIDKIVTKDIDWMAGVGNAAAHNLPEYNDADVPQLYSRVTAFLSRFSPV
jgi:hypothetical protein